MKIDPKELLNRVYKYGEHGLASDTQDAIEEIIERELPVKPLDFDDTEKFFVKCICGHVMDSRFFKNYCTKCGQRLLF